MNIKMENVSSGDAKAVSEALAKVNKNAPKEGVDLLSIAEKLSAKKFGKNGKKKS